MKSTSMSKWKSINTIEYIEKYGIKSKKISKKSKTSKEMQWNKMKLNKI